MAVRGPTRATLQSQCHVVVPDAHSLRRYVRTAVQLWSQGEAHYTKGNLALAYVYLKRFVSLALDGLPRHRKYPGGVDASDRAWLQKEGCRIYSVLQTISAKLDDADARRALEAALVVAARAAAAAAVSRCKSSASSGIDLLDMPWPPTQRSSSATPVGSYSTSAADGRREERVRFKDERRRFLAEKKDFEAERRVHFNRIDQLQAEIEEMRASNAPLSRLPESSKQALGSISGLDIVLEECMICREVLLSGIGRASFGVMSYSCGCSHVRTLHVNCIVSMRSLDCPVCREQIVVIAPSLMANTPDRVLLVRNR